MLNTRQKYILNELKRITEKVSTSLDGLKQHITEQLSNNVPKNASNIVMINNLKKITENIELYISQLDTPVNSKKNEETILLARLKHNLEQIKGYNYIEEDYTTQEIISPTETSFQAFQRQMISIIRSIYFVTDVFINLIVSLSTGKEFKTYSEVGETPFALAITGRFQFFPNQATTFSDIMEELDKANSIFIAEFPDNDTVTL